MNLPVLYIEVVDPQSQRLTNPHARPQKQKKKSPVPNVLNHAKKLSHIGWVYRPRKRFRELQLDTALKACPGDDLLLHQKMQKSDNAGHSRPYRGDTEPPLLLLLDKGFKIDSFNLSNITLARFTIKGEEESDGCKGACERFRLMVQTPLVAHVALKMVLRRNIQAGKLLQDSIDRSLCRMLLW